MPLTDTAVRTAKSGEKPYTMFDGHGLYLLIQPSGKKYWRLQYRLNDKRKLLGLGTYPEVSLAEAREHRTSARKLMKNGCDPVEIKRERKRAEVARSENSFEKVAREWHEHQKQRWSAGHAERVMRSLEKDIFPVVGKTPIQDLTAPALLDAIRRIEKRDALDYSGRVLQRVSAVFRYAISTGRVTYNPAADLVGALKRRKLTHRPALGRDDLPEFFKRLQKYDGHPLTRLGLHLIVLTFLRSRELRGARWEEFDFERAEWRVPAARMKMSHDHIVPLARQSIAILRELQPLTGSYDLVFAGRSNVSKPMSENTLLYGMYRMGYHSQATVHGFRATASTILNEMGFRPDVIERQLAHIERNKVRAAYHRSEYLDDRRKMMQVWADYLDSVQTGGNVVPLHGHASPPA